MFPGEEKENHKFRSGYLVGIKRQIAIWYSSNQKSCVILSVFTIVVLLLIYSANQNGNLETEDLLLESIPEGKYNSKAELDALRSRLENQLAELRKREQTLNERENSLNQLENQLKDERQEQYKTQKELEREINDLREQVKQIRLDTPNTNTQGTSNIQRGSIDHEKRDAVKKAFLFAWNGYKERCWGQDELRPVDGGGSNWIGLGLTIIDSLDTLWIMDLKDQFAEARDWVAKSLRFDISRSVSFFETTIRVLGGLLSAYDLSKDKIFLEKAEDLGNRFLPAFNTKTGLPKTTINLLNGDSQNPSWTGGAGVLAEMATVQLEFTYLAVHTNRSIFKEKAIRVFEHLEGIQKHNGLYSIYISTDTGHFTRNHITLGAMGDSFYEYLLKLWLLTDKKEHRWRKMYDDAVDNIIKHLIKKSTPSQLTYIAELIDGRQVDKMDHLVCFAGGMFALGAKDSPRSTKDLELGAEITKTCNEFYKRTATGISAELVNFVANSDFIVPSNAKHYLLRPETVESFFVLWRLTHDQIYRDMGWAAFQAIDKYCKATYGYSGIRDVTSTHPAFDNLQQSFFLAETLKYLYLLFSEDELIPLDKYVFNTEAHPLSVIKS